MRLDEQCRKSLDNKGLIGMVLMDLSKGSDCISHELLTAKLEAYGFGTKTNIWETASQNKLHVLSSAK